MTTSAGGVSSIEEEIILGYSLFITQCRVLIASCALWVFEYLLTLPLEVTEIWGKRFTAPQALFYMNRYMFPVAWLLLAVLAINQVSAQIGCSQLWFIQVTLTVLVTVSFRGIFVIRTFAIFQRNWIIFVGLAALVVSKVVIYIIAGFAIPRYGIQTFTNTCGLDVPQPKRDLYSKLSLASDYLGLGFDTIVLILTCHKIVKPLRSARQLGMKNTLAFVILRDGILYFSALVALEIATIIFIPPNNISNVDAELSSIVLTFVDVIEFILVNRLFLNLHSADRIIYQDETVHSILKLEFAKDVVLGNIGAPLRTIYDDQFYEQSESGSSSDVRTQDVEQDSIELEYFPSTANKDKTEPL